MDNMIVIPLPRDGYYIPVLLPIKMMNGIQQYTPVCILTPQLMASTFQNQHIYHKRCIFHLRYELKYSVMNT